MAANRAAENYPPAEHNMTANHRLHGRAAIIKAWNDLPDAWRCHPALKQIHHAAQECEDAEPEPAAQAPQGDAELIERIGYQSDGPDDLKSCLDLIGKIAAAPTNGEALGAVMEFRKAQRMAAARAALAQYPKAGDEHPAELVCAQAYQVVGSMLSDLGQFQTERAEKILDNLSEARIVHDDVLPWPSFAGSGEVTITDAEIDRIAALTEKAMEEGIRGFCRTWGWQQFARTLVENLRPYGLRRIQSHAAAGQEPQGAGLGSRQEG